MENEFEKVMSERTDEELIKIVTAERHKYQALAIETAELEIDKRNIDTTKFAAIKESAELEQKNLQTVDSNIVSTSVRFLHYIIDAIVAYIIAVVVALVAGLILPSSDSFVMPIITLILIFGSFFAYFAVMEIKFQKTIAKFITKTKVVKTNGQKPLEKDIIIRTFCRLIPFDQFSFLFLKNGFHDTLSNTKVIKD